MGLGIERDAMVDQWVGSEEILEYDVVLVAFVVEREVNLMDGDGGEVVVHVMAETSLAVFLLLGCHVAVTHLFHEHNLLLARGQHHEHAGSKEAGGEGVLTKE